MSSPTASTSAPSLEKNDCASWSLVTCCVSADVADWLVVLPTTMTLSAIESEPATPSFRIASCICENWVAVGSSDVNPLLAKVGDGFQASAFTKLNNVSASCEIVANELNLASAMPA